MPRVEEILHPCAGSTAMSNRFQAVPYSVNLYSRFAMLGSTFVARGGHGNRRSRSITGRPGGTTHGSFSRNGESQSQPPAKTPRERRRVRERPRNRDEKRCSRNEARCRALASANKSISPLVLVGALACLIVVVEAEQFRRKSSVTAAQRQTEDTNCQAKLRAQGCEDHRLPETVRHPQPHHREVQERYLQRFKKGILVFYTLGMLDTLRDIQDK